ncbi:MAG: hypothetical protein WBR17_42825 [Paraburkholderia sp.]
MDWALESEKKFGQRLPCIRSIDSDRQAGVGDSLRTGIEIVLRYTALGAMQRKAPLLI